MLFAIDADDEVRGRRPFGFTDRRYSFCWLRDVRRAREQVRRDNPPRCGRATQAQARCVGRRRFIHRERVDFEQSFATTDAGGIVERGPTTYVRVENAADIFDGQLHIRYGRILSAHQNLCDQSRLNRGCAFRVSCGRGFIQSDAHEAFIAFDNDHEMNIAANSNW